MKLIKHTITVKLMLSLLALAFSVITLAKSHSPAEPQTIALNTKAIASGNFVQRKYFKILKHPIKSQGELYFDVDIGLLWLTKQPISSALLLKKSGLFTEDNSGVSKQIKGASAISRLLLSIMSGDNEKISENFIINNSQIELCLNLSPKLPQLAKLINRVQLCQATEHDEKNPFLSEINHIVLHEHSGNRTEIDLQLETITALPEAVRARLQ